MTNSNTALSNIKANYAGDNSIEINENSNSIRTIESVRKVNKEEYSEHDSIIYTKDIHIDSNRRREVRLETLASCTSSEFRADFGKYEQSFISDNMNEIANFDVNRKDNV